MNQDMEIWLLATRQFQELLKHSKLVTPTEKMKINDKVHEYAASELTICSGCEELASCTCHFHQYANDLPGLFHDQMMANFKKALEEVAKDSISVKKHVLQYRGKVEENLHRCGNQIQNVEELRYTTGDPLMEMLCDIFSLQVSSSFLVSLCMVFNMNS